MFCLFMITAYVIDSPAYKWRQMVTWQDDMTYVLSRDYSSTK